MKNLLLGMMLFLCLGANAQVENGSTYEEYMRKSKNKKTAAWVMLGGGAAVGITGLAISIKHFSLSGEASSTEVAGASMFLAGAASMLGSIPFFVSSKKNKKKAMQLQVQPEALRINNKNIPNTTYPALSVKIPIGKK